MPIASPPAPGSLLVTGAGGFVGGHLLPALAQRWPEATLHATTTRKGAGLAARSGDHMRWHTLDVREEDQVDILIRTLRPDVVIHLAAQSHVPTSIAQPRLTWNINLQGTLNLLESIKRHSPDTRMVNIGSSDMYGAAFHAGIPVNETTILQPLNPYAASKAAAELAAAQYARSEGLRILCARPFNHTGPGQREDFVLAAFAGQIARIEAGLQPPVVETGNLDAERDFLDVSDVVAAYLAMLELPIERFTGQVYNIASGRAESIGTLLQAMLAQAAQPIEHRYDPQRQRPAEIATVRADTAALRQATGWQPRISTDAMLERLLDDSRRRIANSIP